MRAEGWLLTAFGDTGEPYYYWRATTWIDRRPPSRNKQRTCRPTIDLLPVVLLLFIDGWIDNRSRCTCTCGVNYYPIDGYDHAAQFNLHDDADECVVHTSFTSHPFDLSADDGIWAVSL